MTKQKHKVLLSILLTFILTLSISVFAAPQQNIYSKTGNLLGFIYQKDGKTPMKDAQIVLEHVVRGDESGEKFESNVTDDTGKYNIDHITAGNYKVKILINDKLYKIKKIDFFINVIVGETNFVSFTLKEKK